MFLNLQEKRHEGELQIIKATRIKGWSRALHSTQSSLLEGGRKDCCNETMSQLHLEVLHKWCSRDHSEAGPGSLT